MDGARTLVDPDSGNYYAANAGAVVVLDARTGSVVAMASNPSFDPNDFIADNSDKYFKDPNNPLINRALNAYATGLDVQDPHLDRHVAERPLPRRAPVPRGFGLPRRLLPLREQRGAVQRARRPC